MWRRAARLPDLSTVRGGIESLFSVQNLAPVGCSFGHFRELFELAADRLLVFPRLSHAIKDVVAEWIIPGDDEHIERLSAFTDGSPLLSKGWPAEPASAGWGSVCVSPSVTQSRWKERCHLLDRVRFVLHQSRRK